MAGNRLTSFNGANKPSTPSFWASNATSSAPTQETNDDVDMLIANLNKISIQDTVRAVLTTNDNFADLCQQLDNLQVDQYRENTLKEADLIAKRVEKDLNIIEGLQGAAKNKAEEEQRLMITHVVQAYIRCLELDIEKWKYVVEHERKIKVDTVQIHVRDFISWDKRQSSAPCYSAATESIKKPKSNTLYDQFVYVQSALNYWRSCYHYIREYEHLIGAKEYEIEKKLWELEQTAISYLAATKGYECYDDINQSRLREPRNINPTTGQPLSIAAIQEMIQQQQEQAQLKCAALR